METPSVFLRNTEGASIPVASSFYQLPNITVQIQFEVDKTLNCGSLRSLKKERVVHFFASVASH
jgi:hypothetical protein